MRFVHVVCTLFMHAYVHGFAIEMYGFVCVETVLFHQSASRCLTKTKMVH